MLLPPVVRDFHRFGVGLSALNSAPDFACLPRCQVLPANPKLYHYFAFIDLHRASSLAPIFEQAPLAF